MPIDLAAASQIATDARPAVISEFALSADSLRRRGAASVADSLADWPLLTPAGGTLNISSLTGTLVLADGLRLAPPANGRVDLSLLPLAWLAGARVSAGPAGVAQGAGALSGTVDLALAPADAGNQFRAQAGTTSRRAIGNLDLRLGGHDNASAGWIAAGIDRSRWHLAGRLEHGLGAATVLWGRALFASRAGGADFHDLALGIGGGTRWHWRAALATGGTDDGTTSSRLTQLRAVISGETGLILPGASQPISLAAGAEARILRLGPTRITARDLFAETSVPILQDRPAAENLVATLGLRQSWIAGRAEPLWQAGARWEFFPGIAVRGQVARGLDDAGLNAGVGRNIGLIATPAIVPGLAISVDWRAQAAGPARLRALDVAINWQGAIGAETRLAVTAMATRTLTATPTPAAVPKLQSMLRATAEQGPWALTAGWRHRSSLPDSFDAGIERQLGSNIKLLASIGSAGIGSASPAGHQALLQVVAGF